MFESNSMLLSINEKVMKQEKHFQNHLSVLIWMLQMDPLL